MTEGLYVSDAPNSPGEARLAVSRHIPLIDGCCPACGRIGPCGAYVMACGYLRAAGCLPYRRPGATRPELLDPGQRSPGSRIDWFTRTSADALVPTPGGHDG